MALAELLDLRFGDAELRESINEFLDAFRRYVHVGAKRYLTLRHSRFNHVPGDHGQNAGAEAAATLVRNQLLDVARVLELVGAFLCVANVRNRERHFAAGVRFYVPGESLNFRLSPGV